MIELKKGSEHLFWNGSRIERSSYQQYEDEAIHGYIWGGSEHFPTNLNRETVRNFLQHLDTIHISYVYELASTLSDVVHVSMTFARNESDYETRTEIVIWFELWTLPFSIESFKTEMPSVGNDGALSGVEWYLTEDDVFNGDLIVKQTVTAELTLHECFGTSRAIVESATQRYLEADDRMREGTNAATYNFYFPPAVATACEQYLIYFGQFLSDIGLNATINIGHDRSATIFEVMPGDERTALSQLHDALGTYLSLPSSNVEQHGDAANIAFLHLSSQIDHLRSQIRLANATIEAKNATILTLSDRESKMPAEKKGDHPENIFGGLVTVGSIKIGVAKINIGEIIRKLKRI